MPITKFPNTVLNALRSITFAKPAAVHFHTARDEKDHDKRIEPPIQEMKMFIDDHRDAHGVEPICKVLPIARQAIMPVSQYSAIQINSLFGQGGIWL